MNARIVVVDWESTEYHSSFNNAFFQSLGLSPLVFASFSEQLNCERKGFETSLLNTGGRVKRFIEVFNLCRRHRNNAIFFLTYDALFIPFIARICSHLFVYEHNTTPEFGVISKHVIWQSLFFKNISRCTQYPQQNERLSSMGQYATYVGSPVDLSLPHSKKGPKAFIYAVGRNFKLSEAYLLERKFPNHKIFVRRGSLPKGEEFKYPKCVNVLNRTWLDRESILEHVAAFYINLNTCVRGSGWFNDALAYRLPVILGSLHVVELYKRTFPGFPYLSLNEELTSNSLRAISESLKSSDTERALIAHNESIGARVRSCIADSISE